MKTSTLLLAVFVVFQFLLACHLVCASIFFKLYFNLSNIECYFFMFIRPI